MIFILPLFGALIGGLAVLLCYGIFFTVIIPRRREALVQVVSNFIADRLKFDLLLRKKLDETHFREYLEKLIDEQLDNFITVLKLQIPMGGMFLNGALAQKLKSQGREEIMKMLPELKRHMIEKLVKEIDVKDLLKEVSHVDATNDLQKHLSMLFQSDVIWLVIYGGGLGLVIGALEALFFF